MFNEHEAFDTQRPSRGPEQNLQWYQAVSFGNGEAFLGDFHRKCFPISDIHVLLRDPMFCNISGELLIVSYYYISSVKFTIAGESAGHYYPIQDLRGEFYDEAMPCLSDRL